MAYEPKVGDEVVLRGEVTRVEPTSTGSMWTMVRLHGGANWTFLADMLEPSPAPDLGESELRGQVTGPWAVALSEAMEKIETRLEGIESNQTKVGTMFHQHAARIYDLEASAKVRDVPATMVNLAHRVQSLEVAYKIDADDGREREDAVRAELDGVLLRVGQLEFARANTEDPVNVRWTADTGQFMWLQRGRDPNIEPWYRRYTWTSAPNKPLGRLEDAAPKRPDARGQCAQWDKEDEVRAAQGRVLKSKTRDVDPQGDWSTARVADNVALSIDRRAIETARRDNAELREQLGAAQKATLQIRAANHRLIGDVQRAESQLGRIGAFIRGLAPSIVKEEIFKILQDPAHGDPPLSDPPTSATGPTR